MKLNIFQDSLNFIPPEPRMFLVFFALSYICTYVGDQVCRWVKNHCTDNMKRTQSQVPRKYNSAFLRSVIQHSYDFSVSCCWFIFHRLNYDLIHCIRQMVIKAKMDGEKNCWLKNSSSRLTRVSFFQGGINQLIKSWAKIIKHFVC